MRVNRYTTLLDDDGAAVLVKESTANYPTSERLNNPDAIYWFCTDFLWMNKRTEEFVYILCFNTKNRMIGFFEISHGTQNFSFAESREIFRNALLLNATSIIMVHNHPSGDSTPSQSDIDTFEQLKAAGKILGLSILDSIVIGHGNYLSLASTQQQ